VDTGKEQGAAGRGRVGEFGAKVTDFGGGTRGAQGEDIEGGEKHKKKKGEKKRNHFQTAKPSVNHSEIWSFNTQSMRTSCLSLMEVVL